jgi:hypothetical protein
LLWCSVLPVLFRRQLRLIITMDGIIHITIEAITTNITTEGITIDIAIADTTIGTGPGLSARMGGAQGIIAIGKPGRGDEIPLRPELVQPMGHSRAIAFT